MNVIFTCGGTGGHINPAIAVANIWKERYPDSKILFIGGQGGMEQKLIPGAGYDFKAVPAHGLVRGKSLKAIMKNVGIAREIMQSVKKCKKIIKEFKPDVVVGTGGYASFPALMAATKLNVPTCVHEANAMPGLTTRMIAKRADQMLVCFEQSVKYYKHPERVKVVGMPVRKEFIFTKKEDARRELGLDERPVILSTFGSQGAKVMNETVGKLFRLEQDDGFPYQHIHAVGSYGWEWMPDYVKNQGVDLETAKSISMSEYIYNMPTVMAAADVVISRAGASSCNEIIASGTPCLLIPSPNVTDNHQEKNARALEAKGGAVVMLEKDCSAEAFYETVKGLLGDQERYNTMRRAQLDISVPDSAERLCDIMESLIRNR